MTPIKSCCISSANVASSTRSEPSRRCSVASQRRCSAPSYFRTRTVICFGEGTSDTPLTGDWAVATYRLSLTGRNCKVIDRSLPLAVLTCNDRRHSTYPFRFSSNPPGTAPDLVGQRMPKQLQDCLERNRRDVRSHSRCFNDVNRTAHTGRQHFGLPLIVVMISMIPAIEPDVLADIIQTVEERTDETGARLRCQYRLGREKQSVTSPDPSPSSCRVAFNPSRVSGTITTFGAIFEYSPSLIIPAASSLVHSAETGPDTILQISAMWVLKSTLPSLAIRLGLVVTPSASPSAAPSRISSRFAVSRKNFISISWLSGSTRRGP